MSDATKQKTVWIGRCCEGRLEHYSGEAPIYADGQWDSRNTGCHFGGYLPQFWFPDIAPGTCREVPWPIVAEQPAEAWRKVWQTHRRDGTEVMGVFDRGNGRLIYLYRNLHDGVIDAEYVSSDGMYGDHESKSDLLPLSQPAPQYRPWTLQTLGWAAAVAIFRFKSNIDADGTWWRSDRIDGQGMSIAGGKYEWKRLLEEVEHSLDHGATWRPCGIMDGGSA